MSIKTISAGLKATLDIEGLRVYAPDELPDAPDVPCALPLMAATEYDRTFDASHDLHIRLLILLAKQDSPSAFNKIIDYIEPTGDSSILAKLQADTTLGSSCDTLIVERNTGIGATNWGGIGYLSTEFEITIYF